MKHNKAKFIFLLICSILLLLTFDPKVFMGGDNAYYMSLAESMLHGKYQPIFQPNPKPETGVPPLYPAILAITRAIFGKSFLPAKILSFIFFVLAIYLWFKFYKDRKLNEKIIYIVLLFAALNPVISEYSHWEITESLFILICALSFWWYDKIQKSNAPKHWFILGLITVLAYFVRATGATISIAIFVTLLIKKRWRELIWFSLANAIILAPWLIRNMILSGQPAGGAYTSQFFTNPFTGEPLTTAQFITKFFKNMHKYLFVNLPTLLFPSLELKLYSVNVLNYIISIIFLAPIVYGIIKKINKLIHITIFLVIYLSMLFMFREDAAIVRYIVPIFPLIILIFLYGINELIRDKKLNKIIIYLILVLMLISATVAYVKTVRTSLPSLVSNIKGDRFAGYNPAYSNFILACEWIRNNTPEDALILCRKPRLAWYFSGRKVVEYPYAEPPKIIDFIDSAGVDFVIVDRMTYSTGYILIPAINQYPERFEIKYVTDNEPKTFVLKVLPKTVK